MSAAMHRALARMDVASIMVRLVCNDTPEGRALYADAKALFDRLGEGH